MADAIKTELQNLLELVLGNDPSAGYELAQEFRVSLPTLTRWAEGKNLPPPVMARVVVDRLKDILWEQQQ